MAGLLRPGIILTVTGALVLGHYFLMSGDRGVLSRRNELIIAVVLLAVGISLLGLGLLGG